MVTRACASFAFCDVSHRVTITFPIVLSERGKAIYLDWLQREFWRYTKVICWVTDNTVRLVARGGKDLAENMMFLKQYARTIVGRINGTPPRAY